MTLTGEELALALTDVAVGAFGFWFLRWMISTPPEPMPRCAGCAHWRPHPEGAYPVPTGSCDVIWTDGARLLTTQPDFGCIRHT